jgi:organic radical activating enzyme
VTQLATELSYTSASGAFPVKLVRSTAAMHLNPVHIQWIPTNRCNLRCEFCSCRNRDRQHEMPLNEAIATMSRFVDLGTRAITISGGGEPLCHPDIVAMIRAFHAMGLKIGMVTNGILLSRVPIEVLAMLTWCRISHADCRTFDASYVATLDRAIQAPIDWAFSYVLGRQPNLTQIHCVVDYANARRFTHVRIAMDHMENGDIDFRPIQRELAGDDLRVIYQPNVHHRSTQCLLGYVKPSVAADFRMYLCCGVQYAINDQQGDFPVSLCMGHVQDLERIYDNERLPFKVSCDRCYYRHYNEALQAIQSEVKHPEFV